MHDTHLHLTKSTLCSCFSGSVLYIFMYGVFMLSHHMDCVRKANYVVAHLPLPPPHCHVPAAVRVIHVHLHATAFNPPGPRKLFSQSRKQAK